MGEAKVIPLNPDDRGKDRGAARAGRSAADAVSAGAARAGGERARRRARTTPLLSEAPRLDPVRPPRPAGSSGSAGGSAGSGLPFELPVFDLPSVDDVLSLLRGGLLRGGIEPLVSALSAAGDLLGKLGKLGELAPDELDRHLAEFVAMVRRRLSGDLEIDDFGFDSELTEKVIFALLRPLYRDWFRVEVSGIEHLPQTGGALLVANHSGVIAIDAVMTQLAVFDEHPAHRHLRMLAADLVFDMPVVGELARKTGATLASSADAERLLRAGELVGVWPEGFKGIGKPFGERYKLQRFGRGGFVSAALRTGAPIIPCSIVGAEEIYPMIGNLPSLARLLGLPYFPVTPTFPWLGPLGLLPLPSKWLIEFGEPIETTGHGPNAADDPMLLFDLTDQVRQTIQQTLYSLLLQRRSVFF